MHSARALICLLIMVMCGGAALAQGTTNQSPKNDQSATNDLQKVRLGSLKICLRLEDQTPFLGAVTVHVFPENGYELLGAWDNTKGEADFYAVPAGRYTVEVTAPGFDKVQLSTVMESRGNERTMVVVLKRQGVPEGASTAEIVDRMQAKLVASVELNVVEGAESAHPESQHPESSPIAAATPVWPNSMRPRWKPAEWNHGELPVDTRVACPLDQVLESTGERVREFIASMEKFTAIEKVDHYAMDKNDQLKRPEEREFAYVATVSRDALGGIMIEEYRNGSVDPKQFPANLATVGLPAIILVFHPEYVQDFDFVCDGLVRDRGHAYWQIRFAQRLDRPERISAYVVNGLAYSEYLKGRAWIDPADGEVVRLESELEKPIPQIGLWEQWERINYTPVKFASTGQEIWLPQSAELYGDRHGRYYRRHTFHEFRLFNVDTTETVKAPKGSYKFTNLTDSNISGELIVRPVEGLKGGPVVLRFDVPARRTVVKTVGVGKDVNLAGADVESAKFVFNGNAGSVRVDVDLIKETTLDVIPQGAQAEP